MKCNTTHQYKTGVCEHLKGTISSQPQNLELQIMADSVTICEQHLKENYDLLDLKPEATDSSDSCNLKNYKCNFICVLLWKTKNSSKL